MKDAPPVTLVVLTHARPLELARTLQRLVALPERPPIVVVDNASPGTATAEVVHAHPAVVYLRAHRNLGAAGRNLGVAQAHTPYVAFCDDDCWWQPGALAQAVDALESHPDLALVSACVRVSPHGHVDPACRRMEASPLPSQGLPGRALIAFMAGAAVMRREAFLAVGGYEPQLFLGAEEVLMALDLATRGWRMVYLPAAVLHHAPSSARTRGTREVAVLRNLLWIFALRLAWPAARRQAAALLREAPMDVVLPALRQALGGAAWVLRRRRPVPAPVEAMYLEVFGSSSRGAAQCHERTARSRG
jgi:GT2 family glycosyltransferase